MKAIAMGCAVALACVAGASAAEPMPWFVEGEPGEGCAAAPVTPNQYIRATRILDRANPLVREVRSRSGHIVVVVISDDGTATFYASRQDCEQDRRGRGAALFR